MLTVFLLYVLFLFNGSSGSQITPLIDPKFAVYEACQAGDIQLAKSFVLQLADPEHVVNQLLVEACSLENEILVTCALELGANPLENDKEALKISCLSNNLGIISHLVGAQKEQNLGLKTAIRHGFNDIVAKLISIETVNKADSQHEAFRLAAECKNCELVKILGDQLVFIGPADVNAVRSLGGPMRARPLANRFHLTQPGTIRRGIFYPKETPYTLINDLCKIAMENADHQILEAVFGLIETPAFIAKESKAALYDAWENSFIASPSALFTVKLTSVFVNVMGKPERYGLSSNDFPRINMISGMIKVFLWMKLITKNSGGKDFYLPEELSALISSQNKL